MEVKEEIMSRKRKIPRNLIYVDKSFNTTYTQNKKTGKMTGRKRVSGYGDRTAVLRVKKGEYAGEIVGRTPTIRRASGRRRGTIVRRL